MMKTLPKVIGTLVLILGAALASGSAMAQYRGHSHGHGHGGVRFGVSVGVPLFPFGYYGAPYYGYPYPVYPYAAPVYAYPPVVTQAPVYVEQGAVPGAQAQSPAPADWFYCADSRTYYPYVTECPGGWQRVPAQPPSR